MFVAWDPGIHIVFFRMLQKVRIFTKETSVNIGIVPSRAMMPVTLPALRSPVSTFALHVREGGGDHLWGEKLRRDEFFHFFGQSEEMPCLEHSTQPRWFQFHVPKSKMDFLRFSVQTAQKVLNLAVPQDFFCRQWDVTNSEMIIPKERKNFTLTKSPRVRCNVW